MKQFFKMFFASVLGVIVAGVIVVGLSIGLVVGLVSSAVNSSSEEAVIIKDNSVLELNLANVFHEQGEVNSFSFWGKGGASASGIYEINQALNQAATDAKIKGLYIKLAPSPNAFATLQQLRASIVQFKKSGKFVYAYGEAISQGALYVASAADSIYLNPSGDITFKGLNTELSFFKNALNKLEIEPVIFYAGKFKSATEPFREEKMSDANRAQISAMQKDYWDTMLEALAQHTHSDTAALNLLAQSGAIQFPEDALQHKLIDGIRYYDEVETILKQKLKLETKKEIPFTSIDEYYSSLKSSNDADNRIAVIFAEGQISDGEASDDYEITDVSLVKTIRKVKENEKIKAVVLRVNSPGGSARASEIILRELKLLHDKKPIVVSMGDMAASGGYYISCAADSIFAMPGTITGSIGVFTMLFNAQKLWTNKLGVTFDQVKNAPYADFPDVNRSLKPEEQVMMQRQVDAIYNLFKKRVIENRKMDTAYLETIAQGRIWTGTAAKANGLVDGIGNLDRAIASAASLAKIQQYDVRTYPEKVDKFKSFMKVFKRNASAKALVSDALVQEMGKEAQEIVRVKKLAQMNGQAMMLLPFSLK